MPSACYSPDRGPGEGHYLRRRITCAAIVSAALLCVPATAWSADSEAAQLTTDPAPSQGFGGAIATAGDLVVVGHGPNSKVYVYERPAGGWSGTPEPIATIFRPTSEVPVDSRFGESVAISADQSLIVVGVPGMDEPAQTDRGRIYVFKRPAGGW